MTDNAGRGSQEAALHALFRAVASGERRTVRSILASTPALALISVVEGATRANASSYYLDEISRHVYAGDTALHVAAAAYDVETAEELVSAGARIRAANRRGAQPLHYAADGIPGSPHWNPEAQFAVVLLLIRAGADPNAADKDGARPLHRAVRTRCAEAVRALLANGADARTRNKAGSTALHLAVQNTGRGGTGSSKEQGQQKRIIGLLLANGARASDTDAKGKSVSDRVSSTWIRELFEGA